jgi:predicted nucleic acid-binding protein
MEPVILLDTNVISELSKRAPNPKVAKWLDENEPEGMWASAITVAELRAGLADLPDGRRKSELTQLVDELVARYGQAPVAFGGWAAEEYARIVVARKRRGRPIEVFDALIAATAVAQNLTLATLNTKDFEGIEGLRVVDPAGND